MRLPRVLTILVGLGVVLGLMLWLVVSISSLYTQVALTSALLANLVLALLLALLAVLLGVGGYYLWLFRRRPQRGKQRKGLPPVSSQRPAAASENLAAIRRQVAQIQDQVAQQALLARAQELERDLQRQQLRLVVFGTGSAGKTSLVNALMGRLGGTVGAAMGTTTAPQTYRCKLRGLEAEILLTDTPGTLEAGVAGTERERLARQWAAKTDLLLFIVDEDLRQSEFDLLQQLAAIGKRLVLVFNKTDRFPDSSRAAILTQLRQRVQGWIAPEDVVAIAAAPQPVFTETGATLKPDPDLAPLLKRLGAILQAEGNDLIADNILLQSQRLGVEARELLEQQRRQQAEQIVERYQWVGAGVIWVTPVPVLDLLATAAVNAQMVVEIGRVYGCELNLERGRELAISLAKTLGSVGIIRAVMELVTAALQLTVGGYVISKAIQSISAACMTRIAGKTFIEYFRRDQDWGDGGITEAVQRQFELNRREAFLQTFVREALTKLPEPLGQVLSPGAQTGGANRPLPLPDLESLDLRELELLERELGEMSGQ